MNLFSYVTTLTSSFSGLEHHRTSETYLSTLRSVLSFSNDDLSLKKVFTPDWLYSYQTFLLSSGVCRNTVVFYMCRLRSLYHHALSDGLVSFQNNLFRHVHTHSEPTLKRAIRPAVARRIGRADFSDDSSLEFSRDMFMLSFYLQGISFIDLAFLRKTDLRSDNTLLYKRRKTGSLVTVAVESSAFEIIEKYFCQTVDSPYLVPIISHPGLNERVQYENALRTHNRRLKKIASRLGIHDNLTSYVARHTWATIAYHQGVKTSIISQAMGHHTEEVTHIYLKSFDHTALSRANKIVIAALFGDCSDKNIINDGNNDIDDSIKNQLVTKKTPHSGISKKNNSRSYATRRRISF